MTSRRIVAVFDTYEAAQSGRNSLLELGLPPSEVTLTNQSTTRHTLETPEARGSFWAHVKEMFVPDSDRHTIEESMRRGGHVLVATVDDSQADQVVETLEQAGAVDLEERESQWRAAGWMGGNDRSSDQGRAGSPVEPTTSNMTGTSVGADTARTMPTPRPEAVDADQNGEIGGTRAELQPQDDNSEAIPVVREELRVGKREVSRGSVRVRSYIVEEPVHEEVRLREERVHIERRPVADGAPGSVVRGAPREAFQERTVEMTETAEQAVVGKEARVTEEVLVGKVANERVERIDDTLRHTEVEVDDSRDAAPNLADSPTRTTPSPSPRVRERR